VNLAQLVTDLVRERPPQTSDRHLTVEAEYISRQGTTYRLDITNVRLVGTTLILDTEAQR
jgi:hypothetical protein